jgi:hypothetical protein
MARGEGMKRDGKEVDSAVMKFFLPLLIIINTTFLFLVPSHYVNAAKAWNWERTNREKIYQVRSAST